MKFYIEKDGLMLECLVDDADWDLVRRYTWHIDAKGYLLAYNKGSGDSRVIRMHRLILGVLDSPQWIVDHKNRNKRDNRRDNIRVCSPSQSCMNRGVFKNSKSGVRGVRFLKRLGKWDARITVGGKTVWLGAFANADEASAARCAAERRLFAEFSPTMAP